MTKHEHTVWDLFVEFYKGDWGWRLRNDRIRGAHIVKNTTVDCKSRSSAVAGARKTARTLGLTIGRIHG